MPSYGLTSRRILSSLLDAVKRDGVPHPLHVHASNLGLPGSDATPVDTMAAAEGRRIHFAHAQFYSYAERQGGGFWSAARRDLRRAGAAPERTLDVGQVVFGQTCTISLDILRQFVGRKGASREMDRRRRRCEGGGIVPFAYRRNGATTRCNSRSASS